MNGFGLRVIIIMLLCLFAAFASAETHWNFQSVDATGQSDYSGPSEVSLEGIVLNRPGEILDPTPDYFFQLYGEMGGEYQIFVQGEGGDLAGTAVWVGQNYGNLPFNADPGKSYTNEEWIEELKALNPDPNTPYSVVPGDRVRITGHYLSYRGKLNVNEQHTKAQDVTIELLDRGAGLELPEVITLDELKDSGDMYIFDESRTIGCERYQARLVRINGVSFTDAGGWGSNADLVITDGSGRTFPVKLGLGPGFFAGSNSLNTTFDVIGILDQEAPGTPPDNYDYKSGYYLWIPDYDGNPWVLADRSDFLAGINPADLNLDGAVDHRDYALYASQWLSD